MLRFKIFHSAGHSFPAALVSEQIRGINISSIKGRSALSLISVPVRP